jgi:tagaturonate reductase
MKLTAHNLADIVPKDNMELPLPSHLSLPVKVLQFGAGVLLRGLPDYFIDKANKQGLFNGSIIVVKSTEQNKTSGFEEQDNLYTICIKGIEHGQKVNQYIVNSAISRVLSAKEQWDEVLNLAAYPELKTIISNTTEIGIVLKDDEQIKSAYTPESFPGKLLAFLYRRYQVFKGEAEAGMVILPTELIADNGTKLKAICLELARINHLEKDFITWLDQANDFCDTLVDRIVPGALRPHDKRNIAEYLGYEDDLMIMSEVYNLWAIETKSERTKDILSFAKADDGIIVTESIEKFRDLKLRLLNGAHTFSCGLALLSGFETVKEAMENAFFERYINDLMVTEITPTLTGSSIKEEEAVRFSRSVQDRFRNPYIEHRWESIATNYTSKMIMRNIPTLLEWYQHFPNKVPKNIALGFASYVYFMRTDKSGTRTFTRNSYGKQIPVDDQHAETLYTHWQATSCEEAINRILSDKSLWNTDLTKLPGFEEAVMDNIRKLRTQTKLNSNTVSI